MATETQNLLAFVGDPQRVILAHLATNPRGDYPADIELDQFIAPTFGGYAPIPTENWSVDESSKDDLALAKANLLHWVAGAVANEERVTLMYFTHKYGNADPVLWRTFWLDDPVTIQRAGQAVDLVPSLIFADLP